MAPLIAKLLSFGATTLANALLQKGKEKVEEKLGVTLPPLETEPTLQQLTELKALQDEHMDKLLSFVMEEEKAAQDAVTDRWKSDMMSDNKLSKNVRPGVLIYLTFVYSLFAFLSSFAVKVDDVYVRGFEGLLQLVYAAYFLGRSGEKALPMIMRLMGKTK